MATTTPSFGFSSADPRAPGPRSAVTRRGRWLRMASWAAFALIILAFVSVWVFSGSVESSSGTADLLVASGAVAAIVSMIAVAARTTGVERHVWWRFAVLFAFVLAGEVFEIWYAAVVTPGRPPAPFGSSIVDIAAFAVFVSVVWDLTEPGDGTALGRLPHFVDVLTAAVIGAVILWVLVMVPVFQAAGQGLYPALLGALYPWLGAVIVMWTLFQIFGSRPSRWSEWERPGALGFLLFAVGVAAWPLWYLSTVVWHDPLGAAFADIAWMGGSFLVAISGVYRLTAGETQWRIHAAPPRPLRRPVLMRAAVVGVALLAAAVFAFIVWVYPMDSAVRVAALGGGIIITVAVVLRTGLGAVRSGSVEARTGRDAVTGLPGHRVFHTRLESAIEEADDAEPLSLVLLDLDDFEHVNVVSGYAEGDSLLARAAHGVAHSLQGDEAAFRLGGDEFGLLLPGTDTAAAGAIAHQALDAIRRIEDSSGAPLRASAGIATYPRHAERREELVDRAGNAMFVAKYSGKDQVVVWSDAAEEALDPDELQARARAAAYVSTVRATAAAVDARVPELAGHSRDVGSMALRLARRAGLDDETARMVQTAGLLHDVGKVGVPDAALAAPPEALPDDLRRRLEAHPILGATIVSSTGLTRIPPWIAAHHERWDGTGYPEGRSGEDIPLPARIIAVADGYDRLLRSLGPSARVRRSAVTERMREQMGAAYDPLVVLHLLSLLADEEAGTA